MSNTFPTRGRGFGPGGYRGDAFWLKIFVKKATHKKANALGMKRDVKAGKDMAVTTQSQM